MLYTLIPPILVIISLIGIIIFLLKKAHRVAGISSLEKNNSSSGSSEGGLLPGKNGNGETRLGNKIKTVSLAFLEKVIRRIRVIFLRLENTFTFWSEALKEKRKRRLEETDNDQSRKKEEDVIEKINNYSPEKRSFNDRIFRRKEILSGEKEKTIRPLIKDGYEKPNVRVEIKNQLEKLLIERIASNPKDTEAYERLGEYYFEIGNYNHSKECYKQVMKLNPRNIGVRSRMKKLERLLGR